MFHTIIPILVDYIEEKWQINPKKLKYSQTFGIDTDER